MYDVFAIAAYVINKSIDFGKSVSNLKLQKILFYIQAAFLVKIGEPCFEADIQAWKHGPVVPSTYRDFRDYGADLIEDKIYSREDYIFRKFFDTEISTDNNDVNSIYGDLMKNPEHIEIINNVIDAAKKYTAWELVDKTHEDLNWSTFYTGKDNHIIDIEDIRRHYVRYQNQLL